MKLRQYLPEALTLFLVFLMVGSAELLHEKEIIFPEITALAVGALLAPKRSWNTSRIRMLLAITVSAVLGLSISVFLPFPLALKVMLAFLACQILYMYSGTTFAPMISAAVLPVLMGTESIIYPVAAFALTVMVMLAEAIVVKKGLRPRVEFSPLPKPGRANWLDFLLRSILAAVVILAAIVLDMRFCVAPPLLVAFTEFSCRSCSARKKPVRAVLVITACAAAGALSRLLFSVYLGLPLTFSAVLAALLMIVAMRWAGMCLPPAGALAILPLIIPPESLALYPLQIFMGASMFMIGAMLFFREGAVRSVPLLFRQKSN